MVKESLSAIEVSNVETRFGPKVVHDGVTFALEREKISAIIGGSGAGKSVLFREILGLLKPHAGHIAVLGEDVWQISPERLAWVRSRMGVLFQSGALFSGLTVWENVAQPIREYYDVPDDRLESIVEGKLLLSGLPRDAADKMPADLSGGMVKRAALARALALEPEIVFLDEPTSGLDPIMARAFDELIRVLCDNLGLTICMITHDLASLRAITDKIVVLGNGRVIAQGNYEEIRKVDDEWIRTYFASDR